MNYIENTNMTFFVLITASIITILIRILPLIIKLPEDNRKVNRFFSAMPFTALTVLVFPDIFTSTGDKIVNIITVIIAMIIITIYSVRKVLKK